VRSRNNCRGKATNIIHLFACVSARACMCVPGYVDMCMLVMRVALLIQHSTRMCHIVTSFVAFLAPRYFSKSSHKRHDLRKKLLNIKCMFRYPVQLLSKTFFIIIRIWPDIVTNLRKSHVKYLLFMSDFNETWIFPTDFRKTPKY
jgi:hypothetical protein